MMMISVMLYIFTGLSATISGLIFVVIGQNRAIRALLSGLKFKKIAEWFKIEQYDHTFLVLNCKNQESS